MSDSFEHKALPIKHIPGPEGVRGRNSNNELIKEKLGWAPSISMKDGLKVTYFWIKEQLQKEGGDAASTRAAPLWAALRPWSWACCARATPRSLQASKRGGGAIKPLALLTKL